MLLLKTFYIRTKYANIKNIFGKNLRYIKFSDYLDKVIGTKYFNIENIIYKSQH